MEKANLKDLSSFSENVEKKKFYLINSPFKDICGDNIIRFLSKQIIEGLEKFDRSEYLHLDIKPGNILILQKIN